MTNEEIVPDEGVGEEIFFSAMFPMINADIFDNKEILGNLSWFINAQLIFLNATILSEYVADNNELKWRNNYVI